MVLNFPYQVVGFIQFNRNEGGNVRNRDGIWCSYCGAEEIEMGKKYYREKSQQWRNQVTREVSSDD